LKFSGSFFSIVCKTLRISGYSGIGDLTAACTIEGMTMSGASMVVVSMLNVCGSSFGIDIIFFGTISSTFGSSGAAITV